MSFFEQSEYDTKFFIMIVFLIGLPIVANNILLSFSIEDQQQVMGSAFIQNLKIEIQFFHLVDGLLLNDMNKVETNKSIKAIFFFDSKDYMLKIELDKTSESTTNTRLISIYFEKFKNLFFQSKNDMIKQADYRDSVLYKWQKEREEKKETDVQTQLDLLTNELREIKQGKNYSNKITANGTPKGQANIDTKSNGPTITPLDEPLIDNTAIETKIMKQDIKQLLQIELDSIKIELTKNYQDDLNNIKKSYEEDLNEIKRTCITKITSIKDIHKNHLDSIISSNSEKLDEITRILQTLK